MRNIERLVLAGSAVGLALMTNFGDGREVQTVDAGNPYATATPPRATFTATPDILATRIANRTPRIIVTAVSSNNQTDVEVNIDINLPVPEPLPTAQPIVITVVPPTPATTPIPENTPDRAATAIAIEENRANRTATARAEAADKTATAQVETDNRTATAQARSDERTAVARDTSDNKTATAQAQIDNKTATAQARSDDRTATAQAIIVTDRSATAEAKSATAEAIAKSTAEAEIHRLATVQAINEAAIQELANRKGIATALASQTAGAALPITTTKVITVETTPVPTTPGIEIRWPSFNWRDILLGATVGALATALIIANRARIVHVINTWRHPPPPIP